MVNPAEILPESIRPIRRREYDQMVALGLFEDERVELLEGVLVTMSPIGPDHDEMVTLLTELFVREAGGRARVRPQCTFGAREAAPHPDIAVVPPADYRSNHPETAFLIVEVARSSLKKDRGVKARIYAAAGVPEYWIINLVEDQVEVFRNPQEGSYALVDVYRAGDRIELHELPGVSIDVASLFR